MKEQQNNNREMKANIFKILKIL